MNLQKMMKQAQDMQTKMAEMQARLELEEVEGLAGGGPFANDERGYGCSIPAKIYCPFSVLKRNPWESRVTPAC